MGCIVSSLPGSVQHQNKATAIDKRRIAIPIPIRPQPNSIDCQKSNGDKNQRRKESEKQALIGGKRFLLQIWQFVN